MKLRSFECDANRGGHRVNGGAAQLNPLMLCPG